MTSIDAGNVGHPLGRILTDAAEGRFPDADGTVEVLPPDHAGTWAVVGFTGHAYVLTDADPAEVIKRAPEGGFGAALDPAFQVWLAESREIGTIDAVLVRRGTGLAADRLEPTTAYDDHPRASRAREHRSGVEIFADTYGFVTLGYGLAGRRELSVELFEPEQAPAGTGRRMIAAGLAAASPDEYVWAQVAPGNARSLRAFLAAGFVPVGSEVLITDPTH